MTLVLAADIGGTNIRAAAVDQEGRIIESTLSRAPFGERSSSVDEVVGNLCNFFTTILAHHTGIAAIGIGFPGFFDRNQNLLISSPNLPSLNNVALAELVSNRLGLPVIINNDALCATVGEHRFGAGQGSKSLIHLTLGTGIGGGLIIDNLPYTGEHGMAMEFGHLHVESGSDARRCGCGGRGCVEAYASATAISARFRELSGTDAAASEISNLAIRGDAGARFIVESAGRHLGAAIAEAVKLLDIRTVTVSGGMTGGWDLLYPSMMDGLETSLIPPQRGRVQIRMSKLNDRAGLLGAAALAFASIDS